jgi:hypothetical protein
MALGLLYVLCTSEQAGEITVSIVMACRIRVVAEQEPACLVADRNLEASVCRVAIAADGPAVSSVVLLACSALPVEKVGLPPGRGRRPVITAAA